MFQFFMYKFQFVDSVFDENFNLFEAAFTRIHVNEYNLLKTKYPKINFVVFRTFALFDYYL